MWTALLAKERDPAREVVVLEARTAGHAASGRNGGFCSASLTHGLGNGLQRFPEEMPLLERLGEENLSQIAATIETHGIDCDFQLTGELSVATAPWQLDGAAQEVAHARELGYQADLLDAAASGARAGLARARRRHPARATATRWSTRPGWPGACAAPALTAGVRMHENATVRYVGTGRAGLDGSRTRYGMVRARAGWPWAPGCSPAAAAAGRELGSSRSGTTC